MAENIQKLHLIWLDNCIHSEDNVNTQRKIQSLINQLEIFDDIVQCLEYIQSISLDDQIILIISGNLSQEFIPEIHEYEQITSIYIYCLNIEFYQSWSKEYVKIKGVYNVLEELIAQMPNDQIRRRRRQKTSSEPLQMSILNTKIKNQKSTSALDGQFVHSQLLIDCLLRMPPTANDKDDFITLYLKRNDSDPHERETVNKFQESYSLETAIHWYTKESFVFRIINHSLRIQDIDLLFSLRFLIRDIGQQLEKYRCEKPIRLYRGQFISNEELNVLKQSKGDLISVNTFFSTTKDRDVAACFNDPLHIDNSDKLKRVLFEIDANPCEKGIKPFADITSLSAMPDEEEVLMMLGTIFRLQDIYLGQHDIWIIKMNLCSDHDLDVKDVVNHMKDQYGAEQTRLLLFGHVLVDMGHFDEAEKYYNRLLNDLKDDDNDLSHCYHALGKVASEKGEYESSLDSLSKCLKCLEKTVEKDHPQFGFIYTCIGEVYQRKNEYNQALESHKKALQIWTNAYNDQHEYIAWCWNNIAIIYNAQQKYQQALDCLEKSLKIKKRILPSQHPCLANTYLNLGNTYYYLKQYDKALEYYQIAYRGYEISLTPEHPSIGLAIKNIGIIYETQGKYSEALENYQRALSIHQQIFLPSHPDSIQINRDIQRACLKIKRLETQLTT